MNETSILNLKSLKEQVYEYLREQMHVGKIRPGSLINMDQTAKQLGISKTPLRDALIRLEMEGFVTILPRRAVIVNILTHQDIKDYYQIIGALESSAIISAFPKIKTNEIKTMKELNRKMKYAINRDDFATYYDNNLKFHNIYLDLSGNRYLVKTVTTLKKRLYDFPRQKKYIKEWEEASIIEHATLVKLISDGKMQEAANFIRDVHWSFEVQKKFVKKYYPDTSNNGKIKYKL
ncbi:GntR family transcriptional regulator [candidate division KSB1 bacterium]|nr:MAG: GntR family transcriptional regulator [candidate division KSB1 bacterium]